MRFSCDATVTMVIVTMIGDVRRLHPCVFSHASDTLRAVVAGHWNVGGVAQLAFPIDPSLSLITMDIYDEDQTRLYFGIVVAESGEAKLQWADMGVGEPVEHPYDRYIPVVTGMINVIHRQQVKWTIRDALNWLMPDGIKMCVERDNEQALAQAVPVKGGETSATSSWSNYLEVPDISSWGE